MLTVEGQGLDGAGAEVAYGSTAALAMPGKVSEAVTLVLASGRAPPPDGGIDGPSLQGERGPGQRAAERGEHGHGS